MIESKLALLDRAFARFRERPGEMAEAFDRFRSEHAPWLEDFALFMALKRDQGGRAWTEWEPGLAQREPDALEPARTRLADAIESQRFQQFLFFRQWSAVRERANAHGIQIIGDVPIFVAHDSADVWSHRGLFQLDDAGRPTVVAGVPPDYFSATGRNPVYRWACDEWCVYAWVDRPPAGEMFGWSIIARDQPRWRATGRRRRGSHRGARALGEGPGRGVLRSGARRSASADHRRDLGEITPWKTALGKAIASTCRGMRRSSSSRWNGPDEPCSRPQLAVLRGHGTQYTRPGARPARLRTGSTRACYPGAMRPDFRGR